MGQSCAGDAEEAPVPTLKTDCFFPTPEDFAFPRPCFSIQALWGVAAVGQIVTPGATTVPPHCSGAGAVGPDVPGMFPRTRSF